MNDHHLSDEAHQGALFAPESLVPSPHPARRPGPTPDPFAAPARQPATDAATAPAEQPNTVAGPGAVAGSDAHVVPRSRAALAGQDALVSPAPPATDDLVSPSGYPADPDADALVDPAADPDPETEPAPDPTPRRRALPLAGPTLDDVVSRVWEGLRAEVATPCPVCHTEVEASMHGRCGACGSTLD
jgi:hypothetical protein